MDHSFETSAHEGCIALIALMQYILIYSTVNSRVQSIVEYSTLYSEVFVNNVLEATRKAFLRN